MYRQVLDLYATAVDYDPRCDLSIEFFKIVQNKLHFAAHGHTAAEVIYERADSEQPFMGLTTFKGEHPTLADAKIAKNYLKEAPTDMTASRLSNMFRFSRLNIKRFLIMLKQRKQIMKSSKRSVFLFQTRIKSSKPRAPLPHPPLTAELKR